MRSRPKSKSINFSSTTLIIGAGAHVPYELPTAKKLTEDIKDLARKERSGFGMCKKPPQKTEIKEEYIKDYHKKYICYLMYKLNIIQPPENERASNSYDLKIVKELEEFVNSFAKSQVDSIDTYLSNLNKKSEEDLKKIKIGKVLISYFINFYENKIGIGFHSPNWIQYIINNFLKKPMYLQKFFDEPPKIYTFNYDNILEKSIYEHLVHYHHQSHEQALKNINSLNIRHIYGSLDWVFDNNLEKIVKNADSGIMVIGEERSSLEQIKREITRGLMGSQQIYFLGFGFDELNMDIILKEVVKIAPKGFLKMASTNICIDEHTRREIMKKLDQQYINFFGKEEVNCIDLISRVKPIFIF